MKKCRHCRTENEDGALTCSECGLDLSPSPVAQLVANLPSAIRATNTRWLWRIAWALGVPLLLLFAYLFSLGPILRFYGAKPPSVWNRVPAAVRVIYQPLDRMPIPESLARLLRRYNYWWMGVERDKREFRKLMARIDSSITNGMAQSDVIGLLGQPVEWYTNAECGWAHYHYWPDYFITYGGYVTNGFVICFSNGMVLRKSPITSGR